MLSRRAADPGTRTRLVATVYPSECSPNLGEKTLASATQNTSSKPGKLIDPGSISYSRMDASHTNFSITRLLNFVLSCESQPAFSYCSFS